METPLITYVTDVIQRRKSKQIVDQFLKDAQHRGIVNWVSTGRTLDNVYNGLFQYANRHPELGVRCVREDGQIVLYNDSVREDSTLHSP